MSRLEREIEREVREKVAREIEAELAAVERDARTRSPREIAAYRTAAHIARGGACVANPKGLDLEEER